MQNSYKPDILTFEELNAKIVSKQIKLPKFQRNVVWGKQKITKLIESLQKGYPFGSLLLYKKDEENFKLIDGLQRYSAISKYSKEPMVYLPNFDKEFEILKQKFIALKQAEGNDFPEAEFVVILEQIRTNLKKYKLEDKMTAILAPVKDRPEIKNLSIDMLSILEDWIKEIQSQIDFAKLRIPVIYFEGDEESLTEVFQNINEGGKPLSKYEIFASAWSDYEFLNYQNTEIIKVLNQRYDELQEELGDLSLDFEFDEQANINVFEYCFALSKLIVNTLATISKNGETEATKIDTIGFALIAATLGIHNKELHKIGSTLKTWSNESLNQFQTILIENSRIVMTELYQNFSYYDNYFPKLKSMSEFQLVSFIATRIKIAYTIDKNGMIQLNSESNVKAKLKVFSKNMELQFLKNLIEKNWGSAGDSKLDEAIGLNSTKGYLLYLSDPNQDAIVQALKAYMNEQINSNPKQVSTEAKCLLAWLQKKIDQYEGNSNQINKYDIEHIVPKKVLNDNKLDLISPLANLCILPAYDNRSKKNQTLYDWEQKSGTLTVNEADTVKYLYPSKAELQIVRNNIHQLTYEQYLSFLEQRQQVIIDKFTTYIMKGM
ncbi:MAG: DUF262 domain-containing protein [Culicoidibacterales bacterium]